MQQLFLIMSIYLQKHFDKGVLIRLVESWSFAFIMQFLAQGKLIAENVACRP